MRMLLHEFSELLFDKPCEVCRKNLVHGESVICGDCLENAFMDTPVIPDGVPGTRDAVGACWLGDEIEAVIHGFKYGYCPRLIRSLRSRLLPSLQVVSHWRPEVIVPVPLHHTRKRDRGYNQSELLGRMVADELGIPINTRAVKRITATATQTHLNSEQRKLNMAGAFLCREGQLPAGKRVLIVDDVLTTGATTAALASCLGDSLCFVWTLACRRLVHSFWD